MAYFGFFTGKFFHPNYSAFRPQTQQQQHKYVQHGLAHTHRCSLTQPRAVHTYAAAAQERWPHNFVCVISSKGDFSEGFPPNFLHNFLPIGFLQSQLALENRTLTFSVRFFPCFCTTPKKLFNTLFESSPSRKSSEEKLLFFPCCHFCQWPRRRRRQTIRFHRRHCATASSFRKVLQQQR